MQIEGTVGRYSLKNDINTKFKHGHVPKQSKPVGSETIKADGYTEVKVSYQKRWRCKQYVIWEQHYGKVPEGHVVVFGDRNKQNFNIDNLILISKKQFMILNRNGLIQNNADLTRTGILIADLYLKVNERARQDNKRKK